MVTQINFKSYLVCLALALVASLIVAFFLVYIEREKFNSTVHTLLEKSDILYKITEGYDFNAGVDQIDRNRKFKGEGFYIHIYELYKDDNINTFQIIEKSYSAETITYLRKLTRKEYYYEDGHTEYDSWGYPYYINGELKERVVVDEDIAPSILYQSAKEYWINEMNKLGAKTINKDPKILLGEFPRYFGLVRNKTEFPGPYKYGNDYYSIDMSFYWTRDEAVFFWGNIFKSLILCFLFLSSIPTVLVIVKYYSKAKFLIVWCTLNYLFLSISLCADYIRISSFESAMEAIDTHEIIWPFTKKIIDMRKKNIFEGKDIQTRGIMSLISKSNDEYINAIHPLYGYDYTEFIGYLILGCIIHILIVKTKS